jgi:hypothetical protein
MGSDRHPDMEEIEVLLSHPWVNDFIPLVAWMNNGPGAARPLVRPIAARHRMTKEILPLRIIPWTYRNTGWSRFAIRRGWVDAPPWQRSQAESRRPPSP